MKTILTQAGVDPGVWKPHAVRSASSSHHSTTRQLDLEQICRLADWSMASTTYLKFYKRYVWVLSSYFYLYCSYIVVHVPLLHWSSDLFIYFSTSSLPYFIKLSRVTSHYEVHCLHFIIANISLRICSWIYVFFIYPLTEVHMIYGSLERYAAFLLAPAEGWSLFTLQCFYWRHISLKAYNFIYIFVYIRGLYITGLTLNGPSYVSHNSGTALETGIPAVQSVC